MEGSSRHLSVHGLHCASVLRHTLAVSRHRVGDNILQSGNVDACAADVHVQHIGRCWEVIGSGSLQLVTQTADSDVWLEGIAGAIDFVVLLSARSTGYRG